MFSRAPGRPRPTGKQPVEIYLEVEDVDALHNRLKKKGVAISERTFMAYDERLAERICRVFEERRDIAERKMFGGLAFLCRGRMCCGIVGSDLMVRVADDEFEAIMGERHVRPMDFTGKPLRGFVYVSPPGFRTAIALRTWLSRGERVAEQKAAKPRGQPVRRRQPRGTV